MYLRCIEGVNVPLWAEKILLLLMLHGDLMKNESLQSRKQGSFGSYVNNILIVLISHV